MPIPLQRRHVLTALAAACAPGAWAQVPGDAWPTRPLKIIMPAAAGGIGDTVTRLVVAEMSKTLGQPIVVENVVGASGTIGIGRVAKSTPDGYTLLAGMSGGFSFLPMLDPNVTYDPLKDFTPIGQVFNADYILVARKNLEYNTVAQLVAAAKANPGKITFASAGIGGAVHLGFEQFQYLTGTKLTHVPYKGEQPGVVDLLGGQVDLGIFSALTAGPFLQDGRMKPLAAAGAQRIAAFPAVPTMAEAGVQDFSFGIFLGFSAPTGTPPAVVQRLNDALVKALATPSVRDTLVARSVTPVGGKPEAYTEFLKKDIERSFKVIKAANIKLE